MLLDLDPFMLPLPFPHCSPPDLHYTGRSWLEGPKDKRCESEYCYLPKRWVHTWTGHTKVRAD